MLYTMILIVLLSVVGCSYNNVHEIDQGKTFKGIDDLYRDSTSGPSKVNIIFVHGMGEHQFGDTSIKKYQDSLAKALGFNPKSDRKGVGWEGKCDAYNNYQFWDKSEKERLEKIDWEALCPLWSDNVITGFVGWTQFQAEIKGEDRTLNMFELNWDRTTGLLQRTILELDSNYEERVELDDELEQVDGGKDREKDRARLNRELKKFVNQYLADPVLYMGAYGDVIRKTVSDGLLRVASVSGAGEKKSPYVIVSDSLGSVIVFNTVGDARLELERLKLKKYSASDAGLAKKRSRLKTLTTFQDYTAQVFMNANQLPLLSLGAIKAPRDNDTELTWLQRYPCGDQVSDFLKLRQYSKDKTIQFVAFSDPNDALSYHLTKRFQSKCKNLKAGQSGEAEIVNVRLTNAKWNYLFLLANPYEAHSNGFRSNTRAIDFLVNGYKGDKRR